jgi:cyclase
VLKKRLVFTFLVQNDRFMLSRNFSLQSVGDLEWVRKYYEFDAIAFSIDELVILNVERGARDMQKFARIVREMAQHSFMPIAAGGGIRSVEDARLLLRSGADKIVINTPLFTTPDLVRQLVGQFGSQCIVASIDYRRAGNEGEVFIENGTRAAGVMVSEAVAEAQALGGGELYLTSIARDGTGQGLDIDYVSRLGDAVSVPIIISGGAGNFAQLSAAIRTENVSAVSTANLFNFMGDSLTDARLHIIENGVPLATWGNMEMVAGGAHRFAGPSDN